MSVTQIHDENGNRLEIVGGAAKVSITGSLASVLSVTQDSSANAINTLTVAGVVGQSIYVEAVEVVISGASAGSDIKVLLKDEATTKWKTVIGSGANRGTRVGIVLPMPIKITSGVNLILSIDAGGSSVITTANVAYYMI